MKIYNLKEICISMTQHFIMENNNFITMDSCDMMAINTHYMSSHYCAAFIIKH